MAFADNNLRVVLGNNGFQIFYKIRIDQKIIVIQHIDPFSGSFFADLMDLSVRPVQTFANIIPNEDVLVILLGLVSDGRYTALELFRSQKASRYYA